MKNTRKRYFTLILIIICILSLNTINAADIDNNGNILRDVNTGTYTDLVNDINGQTEYTLTKNYTFDPSTDDSYKDTGIPITTPITIDGNGFTISGSDTAPIFNISARDVNLTNIIFTNAKGAITVNNPDCTITNSKFYNNNLTLGTVPDTQETLYAGAIIWRGDNGLVESCDFVNNSADHNGAILWTGKNGIINNSNFIANHAEIYQSAVRLSGDNDIISNSKFINNTARSRTLKTTNTNAIISDCVFINNSVTNDIAVIQWSGTNGTLSNSNFTNNNALTNRDGVIRWDATYGNLSNCVFINNSAQTAVACINWNGANGTVSDSIFINNTARTSDIGAIDWFGENGSLYNSIFIGNTALNNEAGAIQWRNNGTISNCNFTNNIASSRGGAIKVDKSGGNNATISDCNFINNTAVRNGGAIAWESNMIRISYSNFTNNAAVNGGAIILRGNDTYNCNIDNANFIDNVASINGGGIYSDCNLTVDSSYFNGNNATKGSGIFNDEGRELYIANTNFGKNRADSSNLTIEVGDLYYYPENVTFSILFKGNDNIANAIWNNNTPDYVTVNNITYEVFLSGNYTNKTTSNTDVHPVDGYENSNNGLNIWQDDLENAQLINFRVVNEHDEVVLSETGSLTGLGGNITRTLVSPEVANYAIYAEHNGDVYYTSIDSNNTFRVINHLTTQKVTTDTYVTVGDNVTYTITITNTGEDTLGDIEVIENPPAGFILTDYSSQTLWAEDSTNVFKYNRDIAVGETITLTLRFSTTETGRFTNTINVKSNETDYINVSSNRVTVHDPDYPVYHPNLTITKVVENDTIFVNDKAVFTINVTNTGDERLTNVFVIEDFDKDLIFDNYTSIVGNWSLTIENNIYKFILPTLGIDRSASFKVYFNTTKTGFFSNNVTTGFETINEANTTSNVTVIKVLTNVTVENITTMPGENITIPINVTPKDNTTINDNVTIIFPDGSNQTVEIINNTGNATWTVPDNYTGVYNTTVEYNGNETYEPSNGTGIIDVRVPTETIVGNVSCYPNDNITIPITVIAADGGLLNDNITVFLPDGTKQTVEIINGKGSVNWTIPEDYDGNYSVYGSFDGDDHYLPSNGTGFVYVPAIPTHIIVGNVSGKPGDTVIIPITVTADDGIPFNGNLTVLLPDGTNKTVEIINGKGSVSWVIPKNYKGDYNVLAYFEGSGHYLPSSGIGFVNVVQNIPKPSKDTNNGDFDVSNDDEIININTNDKVTGNPIIALLFALALLGVGIKTKK